MFKKIFSVLVFIFGIISFAKSQQLPVSNQYLVNKYSLSPAFAGFSKHTEGFLGFRQRRW